MDLPSPDTWMPAPHRGAIVRFWIWYWLVFFALLPWMLVRQVGITLYDLFCAWWTCDRRYHFFGGELTVGFVGAGELLITAGLFGERFTWLRWRDVVIDPGPARARAQVDAGLAQEPPIATVFCTHFHEEHIGNAAWFARLTGIPLLGSEWTLNKVRQPEILPEGRRLLMGQPAAEQGVSLITATTEMVTPQTRLRVIDAAGHCEGHLALFDPERRILFAGDAFLHELFTAPNCDSDARVWIATLERFAALDVQTLIGAHGCVYSCDPDLPVRFAAVRRADPNVMIKNKLDFMRWAQQVVAIGEARGLSYSVIEACLFPWQRQWSWRTWFHDEGFRLLTGGEFSRTHFVRSLSATPRAVPIRFPWFVRHVHGLALRGPELLRIHLLAARPLPVLVIAGSIFVSMTALQAAVVLAPIDTLFPATSFANNGALALIAADQALWLIPVFGFWCWWWAVIGGAITRVMGLAVAGLPKEPFLTSIRICTAPALFLPSALASCCLMAIALAPRWPWLLAFVPPVWLIAGFLYGAMCIDRMHVRSSCRALQKRLKSPWNLLVAQAQFLVSFVASIAVMYSLVAGWWLLASLLGGGWLSTTTLALTAPAFIYGLGYTTANLKSLQLYLFISGRPVTQ
jgi:hydroxyacylglutathione hydrolase